MADRKSCGYPKCGQYADGEVLIATAAHVGASDDMKMPLCSPHRKVLRGGEWTSYTDQGDPADEA